MGVYEILKDAGSVLREAGKIELYQQILDVQQKLLEMQNNIETLTQENKDLKEKSRIKENLEFKNNSYWISGENSDGPFCSRCWDADKKLLRLHSRMNSPGYFVCPFCDKQIAINPPQPRTDSYYDPPSYL